MQLSKIEEKIIKHVIHQFLTVHKAVPRRKLVSALKSPESIDRLVSSTVLRQDSTEELLPMVLAFEYCGDGEIAFRAKRAVGIVLRALYNLYEVETDKTEFSSIDVEVQARKLYGSIEPDDIKLGLYLAQEFGVFGRSGGSEIEITKLRLAERIVTLNNTDDYWDQYVARVRQRLEREHQFDRIVDKHAEKETTSGEQLAPQPLFPEGEPSPTETRKAEHPVMIFLGHGRNSLWARVQIHLKDDLGLNAEAWESESRVGQHNIDVLKKALTSCSFAVIVFTAEDKTAEGEVRARQNVVHEIGLFQGKLGFEKVALLQQDGVEEFTNIAGLQVIRFPDNKIESGFYELDRTLRREGIIK